MDKDRINVYKMKKDYVSGKGFNYQGEIQDVSIIGECNGKKYDFIIGDGILYFGDEGYRPIMNWQTDSVFFIPYGEGVTQFEVSKEFNDLNWEGEE